MASLSSNSAKRFLVNFHTRKAMIAMTATPPATEMPIIEPVPRALLPLPPPVPVGVLDAVALLVVEAEFVMTVMTVTPSVPVIVDAEGVGGGVLEVVGVNVLVGEVVVVWDVFDIVVELEEVVVGLLEVSVEEVPVVVPVDVEVGEVVVVGVDGPDGSN